MKLFLDILSSGKCYVEFEQEFNKRLKLEKMIKTKMMFKYLFWNFSEKCL